MCSHPEPSSLLPPHTIPLGHPSAPAPSIQYHASNLDLLIIIIKRGAFIRSAMFLFILVLFLTFYLKIRSTTQSKYEWKVNSVSLEPESCVVPRTGKDIIFSQLSSKLTL